MVIIGEPSPHICQCLVKILAVRRTEPFTISPSPSSSSTSGEEFVGGVLALVQGLSEMGVGVGDVVAIASFNSEMYLQWLLAVAYLGGIAAPLNYRWSLEEARSAVEAVKPVLLAVDEGCISWIEGLHDVPSIKHRLLIKAINACAMKTIISENMLINYQWAPKDIALICFTSGTTGRPKGVALSHTSLIVQAIAKINIVGYTADDVYLHTAPLCHIGGISSCIAVLLVGSCHVFIPKFEAKLAAWVIQQNHVTSLITVPAMIADMISVLRKHKKNCISNSVKKVLNGGGSLSTELVSGAIGAFPHAKLISAYGMTEACSSLTYLVLHDPLSLNFGNNPENNYDYIDNSVKNLGGTCVGKPPPHIELQIQRSDKDNVNMSNAGIVLTRGAHVMVGYWDDSTRTKTAIGPNDWLHTGDVGWIDEKGYLRLLGRIKDNIRSGGESIYPAEVESVLIEHPGVSHALVFGIPDPRLTEVAVACVGIKENWVWSGHIGASSHTRELSWRILNDHCNEKRLTRYKIPKVYIPWGKPFPCTTIGKLKREEARKEVLSYMQLLPSNL